MTTPTNQAEEMVLQMVSSSSGSRREKMLALDTKLHQEHLAEMAFAVLHRLRPGTRAPEYPAEKYDLCYDTSWSEVQTALASWLADEWETMTATAKALVDEGHLDALDRQFKGSTVKTERDIFGDFHALDTLFEPGTSEQLVWWIQNSTPRCYLWLWHDATEHALEVLATRVMEVMDLHHGGADKTTEKVFADRFYDRIYALRTLLKEADIKTTAEAA